MDDENARPVNGARCEPLGRCAGYDSSEREMGYRGQPLSKTTLALMASKVAAARVVRMKLGAHGAAAPARFPYPHRTVAQVLEDEVRHAILRRLSR